MTYPFQPKSTAKLRAGQFWPIRLPQGGFACGMVLDVVNDSRRDFLAGLLDWHGSQEPVGIDLEGCQVVSQGLGHVKMILEGYGWITGELPCHITSPKMLLWTDHLGGREWGLYLGLDLVEHIDSATAEKYPRRSTWGYNVINILAAKQSKTQQAAPSNP